MEDSNSEIIQFNIEDYDVESIRISKGLKQPSLLSSIINYILS